MSADPCGRPGRSDLVGTDGCTADSWHLADRPPTGWGAKQSLLGLVVICLAGLLLLPQAAEAFESVDAQAEVEASDCRRAGSLADQALIDAHLHYSAVDAAQHPPAEIMAILDRHQIRAAVVSGVPNAAVQRLQAEAPARIFPFLSVYRSTADKRDWMQNSKVPVRAKEALAKGVYRGIGELHLFAKDRASPVLAALVDLAVTNDLMLQIHGDAEIIDRVFARAPEVTVLWAHLGTDPRPGAIASLLARYPRLYVDTSVRDGRFVDEQGCLLPEWRQFFIAHSARILVGVDTHWPPRWRRFGEVVAEIRHWLGQLPPEAARRIGFQNAADLFGVSTHQTNMAGTHR